MEAACAAPVITMKPITLPIKIHDDTSLQLDELGIKASIEDCPAKEFYFLSINGISRYMDGDVEYTEIHSNAQCYLSPLPYETVKALLHGESVI